MTEHNARGRRQVTSIAQGALKRLEAYDFPGNVRELSNVIEYAFALGAGPVLSEAELPPELGVAHESAGSLSETKQRAPGPKGSEELSGEARRIARALERAAGHKRRAAQSLGMSRTTLWRKMRELGLA